MVEISLVIPRYWIFLTCYPQKYCKLGAIRVDNNICRKFFPQCGPQNLLRTPILELRESR